MSEQNCCIFNWNVRGLNNPTRRKVVKDLVRDNSSTIVCLQEMKLDFIDDQIVMETLGPEFVDHFVYLPAQSTRGGVLLAVHADFFKLGDPIL